MLQKQDIISGVDNVKEVIQEKLLGTPKPFEPERPLFEHEINKPIFTKEMKYEHTILIPMMLPIHFPLIVSIFKQYGYNVELLQTTHRGVVEEGLKNVHNDTCYPALLVIGQLLDALKSGKYDRSKTSLIITQTGGGCRASNYIHLLRKALEKNNLAHVPVISLNMSNMEPHPGFPITKQMILKCIYACIYGDMIMHLANQCRPYEIIKGHTEKVIDIILGQLSATFLNRKFLYLKDNFTKILNAFKGIGLNKTPRVKVGIVGEIYLKYAPLGNNNLEEYLVKEGAEVVITGVLDFFLYSLTNTLNDHVLYKQKNMSYHFVNVITKWVMSQQEKMANIIKKHSEFAPPMLFKNTYQAVKGYIGHGVKMGEGWLLTGEMVEMVENGVNNVICVQPFGCLPNHIVAKGMIRAIKNQYQDANIIAIDYDPGATKTNQENRIKLMLANARQKDFPAKLNPLDKIVVVDQSAKSNLA